MSVMAEPPAAPFYDPRDPAVIADPLPVLLRLQREEPVHWSPVLRGWVITRHRDVRRIQNSRDMSADRLTPYYRSLPEKARNRIATLIRYLNTWIAFKDPPEHTRMRNLMNAVLTPGHAEQLRPNVERVVRLRLSELEIRPSFDFIADFANPVPAAVMMDLLGLPYSDFDMLKGWTDKMQPFIGSSTIAGDKYGMAEEGARNLAAYFRDVVNRREGHPGDDHISRLLSIRSQDEALTEDEVIGTCILFLVAGHETTTNLIGNGTRALIAHEEEKRKLLANEDLIESAVEECLRYDGPTGALVKVVACDHELHGKTLKQGERVFVMVNAANHDPEQFEEPDRFDIERSPNRHLTFNFGPHFCLGAQIARLEGQIAIGEALRRLPGLRLEGDVEYMDTLVMRGTRSMPVTRRIEKGLRDKMR